MDNNASYKLAKQASYVIALLLLTRLTMLYLLPLFDTTEARYAEIARIMFETNNWVTPQFDYNQPFWGKPPMHTWLSAIGFMLIDVSAFSARLPHFVCGLIVLALVYQFIAKQYGNQRALVACMVLVSSIGFLAAMGMVMTDTALLLSSTLVMVSFWKAVALNEKTFHGHLMFIGLAFGMLIKGPVALVIAGIAIFLWAVINKQIVHTLKVLPWLTGVPLFLAITLPWYLLAEARTPGFLNYFLLGEHVYRFLVAGWEGDLYGSAHDRTRGTIWLYWLIAAFPWSFFLIFAWGSNLVKDNRQQDAPNTSLNSYLLCWMVSPMILFTLAGNILMAYVLPGFAAMAVYIGVNFTLSKRLVATASCSVLVLITALSFYAFNLHAKTSEVALLGTTPSTFNKTPLYYWKKRPFSARFYSRGQAQLIYESATVEELFATSSHLFLAMEHNEVRHFTLLIEENCTTRNVTQDRVLLECGESH